MRSHNTISLAVVIWFLLLLFYSAFVNFVPSESRVAESNLVAGLIRMQSLASTSKDYAALCGSSVSAKLNSAIVFQNSELDALNMGIDGGSPLFAVEKVAQKTNKPKIVLIETNFIDRDVYGNMETLEKNSQTFWFKKSGLVPLLKKENRPSTRLYSYLKKIKDARLQSGSSWTVDKSIEPIYFKKKIKLDPELDEMHKKWRSVLSILKNEGVIIIFITVPQNRGNRNNSSLVNRLSYEFEIPIFDLQNYQYRNPLKYSDGVHLISESANIVSTLLNKSLSSSGFLKNSY